jgi:tyrosyl-tRNA synthetase
VQVVANTASIQAQLEHFLDFSAGPTQARVVDNFDWLGKMGMLEFLRDIGKHFTIPYMLAKDSVQTRLEAGLSYTEFSYMLLQAADFLHLYRTLDVEVQTGGADQWGNITAGLELIRRVEGAPDRAGREDGDPAHALSYPLLLGPNGEKFGKTAEGTSVWLDPERTSPYAFYQFWLDAEDEQVGRLIRLFTLFDRPTIEALEAQAALAPERRPVQRALAADLTARVHGSEVATRVEDISEAVFSRRLPELGEETLAFAFEQLPHAIVRPADVAAGPIGLMVAAGLFDSNGEARRALSQGGVSVNEERLSGVDAVLPAPIGGRYLILRSGKKTYRMVRVEPT